MAARRGRGGRARGRRSNEFDVDIDFELFSLDVEGNERTPITDVSRLFALNENLITSNQVTNYTFEDAIENFEGIFTQQLAPGEEYFSFADAEETLTTDLLTLDLTARYLPEGTILTLADGTPNNLTFDVNGDGILNDGFAIGEDRIEYIFSGDELEALGIFEVALVVEDADSLQDVSGNLILDTEAERLEATSNIESVLDVLNAAISSFDTDDFTGPLTIRVSGTSATDPDTIVFTESLFEDPLFSVVLEAEDLNLDTYLVEDLDDGGRVVSLNDAEARTGTASLLASDFNLLGTYDLEISYFDENDGEAQLEVLVNDTVVDTLLLNEDTSNRFPVEEVRREFIVEDLDIAATDTIAIRGIADGTEWARVDFLNFVPVEVGSEI